jgi:hypothetical protein
MLTQPGAEGGTDEGKPRHGRRRRWPILIGALLIILGALSFATARWIVWPSQQVMPATVDAIVMLNGPGARFSTALDLARQHRASVIIISRGSAYWGHGSVCAPKISRVRVICFDPSPASTRGEAEFAGRLAERYHWRSVAVVAIAPQDTVARLRIERCFGGKIYLVNAPLSVLRWPYQIVYEWGSTLKALIFQRAC